MKTELLTPPQAPNDMSRIFDMTEPLKRLSQMGEDEFERVIGEWAYSCLKNNKNYYDASQLFEESSTSNNTLEIYDDEIPF